jgi:hypothetical protein
MQAADRSLSDLKAIPTSSEAQLAAGMPQLSVNRNDADIVNRLEPTTELSGSLSHRLWDPERQIHRYCSCLSAKVNSISRSLKGETKGGPGGFSRGYITGYGDYYIRPKDILNNP